MTVDRVSVLDPFHHNGDEFWDGDQTLYKLDVVEKEERDSVLVVVPRGNAFITPQQVKRFVEDRAMTISDFRRRARRPAPDRWPQVDLPIEPGFDRI